jgi:2-keto-3-deoxy-L-rhamnonate aldolase RhmA
MSPPGALGVMNPVLARMRAGEVALGMNIRLGRSGDIARIAKATGHDFIFIDAQHSIFSLETIGHIAQTALACGVSPLVRVGSVDHPDTAVLLDNGVAGIVFPDVGTAAQARRGVEGAKFPPLGKRSVAGGYPQFDYRPVPIGEAIPALNELALVVCMIETREGLANVEAIAAVPAVDVLHVGVNDLLTALGKPGQFGDPEIIEAIERVIAVATRHGKFAGVGGDRNLERQLRFIRQGARFITTQTDIGFLVAEASRVTGELRRALQS